MLNSPNPENRRLLDQLVLKTIQLYGCGCTPEAIIKKFEIGTEPIMESIMRLVEAKRVSIGDLLVKARTTPPPRPYS